MAVTDRDRHMTEYTLRVVLHFNLLEYKPTTVIHVPFLSIPLMHHSIGKNMKSIHTYLTMLLKQ